MNKETADLLYDAEVYLFDLDGCIYHTDQPAAGAKALLECLRADGKTIGFITNNSRETATEIAQKLEYMGFSIPCHEIITATEAVGSYLKDMYGELIVKTAGSGSLERSVEHWGHKVIPLASGDKADAIVIGRDTEFSFAKLQQIIDDSEAGTRLVSVNPDMYHPGAGGRKIPETGALVAAIEVIANKKIEFVGKPSPYLFQFAKRKLGVTTEKCIMIGDNLKTDILGGIQAGMATIWIYGSVMNEGVSKESAEPLADITVEGMTELLANYKERI